MIEVHQGISAVEPAVEGLYASYESLRLADILSLVFVMIDGSVEVSLVQPFIGELCSGLPHKGHDVLRFPVFDVLEVYGDIRQRYRVLGIYAELLSESRGDDRLFERRFVGAGNDGGEYAECGYLFPVFPGADDFSEADPHPVSRVLIVSHREEIFHLKRRWNIEGDVSDGRALFETGQIAVYEFQSLVERHVAVQEYPGVGGAVIFPVAVAELLIRQVRDMFGIAAGIEHVVRAGQDGFLQVVPHDAVGAAHGAFHLVEHDTVEREVPVLLGDMPALLIKDVGIGEELRGEDSVKVYSGEVQEILSVAAGYRIDGLVIEGHGVQEGVHGSLEQIHERLLDRVFFRSAEDRVLQDVEHAGAVFRDSLESDAEELVVSLVFHPNELCAGLFVDHLHEESLEFVGVSDGGHSESVDQVAVLDGALPVSLLVIEHAVAVAFEVGIRDLVPEFLAHALVLFLYLDSAGAVAALGGETFPDRPYDVFVLVKSDLRHFLLRIV